MGASDLPRSRPDVPGSYALLTKARDIWGNDTLVSDAIVLEGGE
mgnify:CR=1 FL=1